MSNKDISGKVALVTGGAQGIGQGIALRLASDGADVAVVDLDAERCAETVSKIEEIGRKAIAIGANVAQRDEVYAAIDQAIEALGGFDIMVNNAGIAQVNPISEVSDEELSAILDVNVKGVF